MAKRKYPNAIQCLGCKTVLVSNHRHDFKRCHCEMETFIDGGYDYLRCGSTEMKNIKLLKISTAKYQPFIEYAKTI